MRGPASHAPRHPRPGTKASRRAANQLRTRIAPKPPTNAPRDHVADEMRLDDDAARQDQCRDRSTSATRAFGQSAPIAIAAATAVVRVARRHAGECGLPRPRHIGEGPKLGRAHAPDQPLHDGDEQARQRDREEHVAKAHDQADEHKICDAARRRGWPAIAASTIKRADRNQEPVRFSEIGDLVERVDQPKRQRCGERNAARIEQSHREADEQHARKCAEREPPRRRQEPARLEPPRPNEQAQAMRRALRRCGAGRFPACSACRAGSRSQPRLRAVDGERDRRARH